MRSAMILEEAAVGYGFAVRGFIITSRRGHDHTHLGTTLDLPSFKYVCSKYSATFLTKDSDAM